VLVGAAEETGKVWACQCIYRSNILAIVGGAAKCFCNSNGGKNKMDLSIGILLAVRYKLLSLLRPYL
jgi:hypothetical protein